MPENVQIALIIAACLAVVACFVVALLRNKLHKGNLKVNRKGIQGSVETYTPPEQSVTKINGTKIKGNKNKITTSGGGQIEHTEIAGNENELKSGRG